MIITALVQASVFSFKDYCTCLQTMSPNPGVDPSNLFSQCYPKVFVKCKSEHVSPRCLQDKVPTCQHGIPSLTWSLLSIPDPSLVTSTPPFPIPCHPAIWRFTAHKTPCHFHVFRLLHVSVYIPGMLFLQLSTRQTHTHPARCSSSIYNSVKPHKKRWLRPLYVTVRLCTSFSCSPIHDVLQYFAVCT